MRRTPTLSIYGCSATSRGRPSLLSSLHRHPCRNETRNFWRQIGNERYQPWLSRGSKKAPRPMTFKREGGACSKNHGGNRFWCLDSCALPFAFSCLLLTSLSAFLACRLTFPDPRLKPETDQTAQTRQLHWERPDSSDQTAPLRLERPDSSD